MTFCMCVGLYDPNQHCKENLDCRNCTSTFCAEFCQTKPFGCLYSEMVRDSIVFMAASQQSNVVKCQKIYWQTENIWTRFLEFLYTPKMRLTQFGG